MGFESGVEEVDFEKDVFVEIARNINDNRQVLASFPFDTTTGTSLSVFIVVVAILGIAGVITIMLRK